MLVLVSTTTAAFARDSALRPTGRSTSRRRSSEQLRRDLLAAGAHGPRASRPSPAHPILLRSALRVVGAEPGVRALLVSFRSVTGRSCVGVAFQGSRVAPGPFACLPPLHRAALHRGVQRRTASSRHAGARRPGATARHGAPHHRAERACSQLPGQPEPCRGAAGRARPRPAAERARHPRLRGRHGGRLGALPGVSAAQKTGSSPSHSSARLT